MRTLKTTVLVPGLDGGESLHFEAGARPPSWVCEKYADEDIWADDEPEDEPEAADATDDEAVTAQTAAVEGSGSDAQDDPAQSPTDDVGGSQNGSEAVDEDSDDSEDLIGSPEPTEAVEEPARNGSLADWIAYAQSKGATAEDLTGKTRNQVRAAYGRD